MASDTPGDITRLLRDLQAGKGDAESSLLEVVYPELRKRAARYLRGERANHTLQPTELVNEVYIDLMGNQGGDWKDRTHFFAVASIAMRRILVDYARRRKAAKREGQRARVELTDWLVVSPNRLEEITAVDEALRELAGRDPRGARVVEMRYYGGLTEDEIAQVLAVSPRTVKRDWKLAKAWLAGELGAAGA
ncbi:MAG: sigma-70 family RNA polymerase sigma factor [Bryobacteraceae bacterium]